MGKNPLQKERENRRGGNTPQPKIKTSLIDQTKKFRQLITPLNFTSTQSEWEHHFISFLSKLVKFVKVSLFWVCLVSNCQFKGGGVVCVWTILQVLCPQKHHNNWKNLHATVPFFCIFSCSRIIRNQCGMCSWLKCELITQLISPSKTSFCNLVEFSMIKLFTIS